MSIDFAFWNKVLVGDGCWLWQGTKDRKGYGQLQRDGKRRTAHRYAWEDWHGQAPGDLCVCHHCDQPACVRPDYLFLGTQDDNLKDMATKGRGRNQTMARTHCPRGHPYDAVYGGKRSCRVCRRAQSMAWYHRQKAVV